MNEKKIIEISIIVPVYNAEKYLETCVQSIINQTFSNWELILIDDGSTDTSNLLCDSYSIMDNRIITVHKQNTGVSAARNTGILHASGEYLFFMDSDDFLENTVLEKLLSVMKDHCVDCVSTGIKYIFESSKQEKLYCLPQRQIRIIEDLNDMYQKLHSIYFFHTVCGKLLRRNIIMEHNIRFEERFSILEDGMFVTDYVKYCKRVFVVDDVFYCYRQFDGDSLMKKFNHNAMDALDEKYKKEVLFRLYLNENNRAFYHNVFFNYIWMFVLQIYTRSGYSVKEKRKLLLQYTSKTVIKDVLTEIKKNKCSHYKILVKCFMLSFPNILHTLLIIKY